MRLGHDEVLLVPLNHLLHRGILVAGYDDEPVDRCDGPLVLVQRQLDAMPAGRVIALAHERHRLVFRDSSLLFDPRATLVVLLEGLLVFLRVFEPGFAVVAHRWTQPYPGARRRSP